MTRREHKPENSRTSWCGHRYNEIFETALSAACILCLAECYATVLVAVFFRYVLNDSLEWSEEVARWFLMGTVFLGAVRQGQQDEEHSRLRGATRPHGRTLAINSLHGENRGP